MDISHSEAITAIGVSSVELDWRLDPSEHASRMTKEAEPLLDILANSRTRVIIEQYDQANLNAKTYQNKFKSLGKREILAAAAAAILGGCILFFGEFEEGIYGMLRIGLLCIQALLLAVVISTKYRLKNSAVYLNWQTERSKAESARVELFQTVCASAGPPSATSEQRDEAWLLQLQLEYFIRYQLNVQLFYYKERGMQHSEASQVYLDRGATLTFLIALAGAITGVFGAQVADSIALLAVVGLVAPILLSMQSSLSMLNQDQRNSERYGLTHANLSELSKNVDDIRAAAKDGDRDQVMEFIQAVNDLISIEHKQWRYDFKVAQELTRDK